jgi:hypothetical protein
MKTSIRLALAALALVLTALASIPMPAQALPVCNNLDGRSCLAPGKATSCIWLSGSGGTCYCDPETSHWDCW